MPLIVIDANIFIDIEIGGLTRTMFNLPETFAVPNILYEEELRQHHPSLPTYGLRILDIQEEYIRESVRLSRLYPKPGRNDLLALVLAKQEKCPLLTGDSSLRLSAESENLTVMGTLWLMQQLVINELISIKQASAAYSKMKEEGRRLPWDEVEKQLAGFRKR